MLASLAFAAVSIPQLGTPFERGFAHNDYMHPRPLWDALASGFTNVEADVFLVDGKILVGHNRKDLKPERNLEDLYLKPLKGLCERNGGWVYPKREKSFWLMIDIKEDGTNVYAELDRILHRYQGMLVKWTDARVSSGAVGVVLSGDRPVSVVARQKERLVAIDGRPEDLESNPPAGLVPWISRSFGDLDWPITVEPTSDQVSGLRAYIAKAHSQGRLVRFWGISDTPRFWQLQLDFNVDFFNTDRLAPFRTWADDHVRPG